MLQILERRRKFIGAILTDKHTLTDITCYKKKAQINTYIANETFWYDIFHN